MATQSISVLKEQEITETPLLLFECALSSGEVERWSTHGVVFEGAEYEPRVLRHNVLETRSLSDEGIDTVARVSITLANADGQLSQLERTTGWKGAKLKVRFVFFNLREGTAVSESVVVFRGIANAPEEITESEFRLSFTNRLNLQRILLPEIRIQRRCPWTFPETREQREEAVQGGARGRYSPFFRCGYSPDIAGGVGNLNGGEPFTSCDYTRGQCEARGMFSSDAAGNPTRRFGGIEYLPADIVVRSYGEQGSHVAATVENQARYNDFVPLVYGTAWYEPPVVFARNDGNLTRMEVLLGMGEIEGVVKVMVNGVEVPEGQAGADMTATGWFNVVSTGNRTGDFNYDFTDKSGRPAGDPYGSMAYLSVVVPNRISEGRSLPRVEVLVEGMKVERYAADGTSLGIEFTNNPAWVLLDILRRCGWSPEEIDLGSFARTAEYCSELIPAQDLHGNPTLIPRFQCNLVLRRRRSAADVVRGIRNGSGLYLTYGAGGRLELRPEGGLALQQPEKPDGSNSVEELNGGWPAYEFCDGSMGLSGLARRENGEPTLRFWSRPTADTPNRYSVEFQDAFNEFQQDSLSLVDVGDVLRTGQEVSVRLTALGLPNYNQAARIIRRQLNKGIRGNLYAEFETSVRAVGLKPGDLITLTYLKEGLQRQPFRILKVAAGLNYRRSKLTCQIHDDAWYTDDVEGAGGTVSRRQKRGEVGIPRPLVGSVLDEYGDQQFAITEKASERTVGGVNLLLEVDFQAPAKPELSRAGIPLLSLAAEVDPEGGSLPGDETFYYAVSAVDDDGAESGLSFVVRARTPASSGTNAVRLKQLSFSAGTAGFHVYRGKNPWQLLRIASHVTPAEEFRDDGLTAILAGPPDENYDRARFYWRFEDVPEHAATIFSANTIGSSILQMIADEHAGKVVRITRGRGAGQERSILANDNSTLTVATNWSIVPDATSHFVVAEAGWHFGAEGETGPIQFDVPNRAGATVHVSGRSANALGRECSYELSPLTRWRLGGASGPGFDEDVSGAPTFGLRPTGQGTVELVGVGFADPANIRNIQAGTLTLHYWEELNSPTQFFLAAGLTAEDTVVELTSPGPATVGTLIQIDSEVLVVEEVLDGGLRYEVTRGSHGTWPSALGPGVPVYHLTRKVFVIPFVRDFFGSPASGSFAYPIFLPDVRVAAAEMFVTNTRGNSESTRVSFTGTADQGLRTLSGGQLSLQVEGFLAIESEAAPPLVIEDPHSVRDIFAVVAEAPTGAPVALRLWQDGEVYCELTIPAGERVSSIVPGFGLPPLREKAQLRLEVVSVGQAPGTTPGRDLTVIVRL